MPTPRASGSPGDRPPLEPVRVLRMRRTDALAELLRDLPRDAGYEAVQVPGPPSGSEDATREMPPVRDDDRTDPRGAGRVHAGPHGARSAGTGPARQEPFAAAPAPAPGLGLGPGRRRAAVVIAVAAAALVGFGGALLLPGRHRAASAGAPVPTVSADPTPTAAAPTAGRADPDGAGTLREGDGGPRVTDLQQRLLRVPNVYDHGSTSGRYDAALTAAVARFQLWYGIRGDETGVYGDDTRTALESRTASGTG
ncbi:peptidoglycan-binding domain-containing protein [Streptomyces sp. H51]|uniref:peptidoglycan-binding domain-containing protein n=1 Tax=Streptomyces sp. H51 TaxID=3111770 RepID=UPI002D770BBA|nr:peptidoglycan-binding domain-containing protein [Streptomyces sp. H51]